MTKKWEYKVVDLNYQTNQEGRLQEISRADLREELLNALGQEGWKLVAVAIDTYGGDTDGLSTAYLEREVS